ncbi:hypothetical protein HDG40_007119, partial [Paraburkholderia sp. JPY158]|nr:hypothetical protein [Paraburkholderia atlantica]
MTAERYGVQIKVEHGYLDGTLLAPKTTVPGVLLPLLNFQWVVSSRFLHNQDEGRSCTASCSKPH